MARIRSNEKTLISYFIRRSNLSIHIQVGDCVLMRPPHPLVPMYVAKIKKITSDIAETEVKVRIQWYYRPEDTLLGRKRFHGIKELFLSDHYDTQSVDTIERRCSVHSFQRYTTLEVADDDDFFCRFRYSVSTAKIHPPKIKVHCVCDLPCNPDKLMIQCEGCTELFHPTCIGMTEDEALLMGNFFCQSCLASERRNLHP